MNWACPHCFTALYVSEDRLTTSWSFARCYLCAGVSLVKRGELNLLKIDRAPKSEPLLAADAVALQVKPTATAPLTQPMAAAQFANQTIAQLGRPNVPALIGQAGLGNKAPPAHAPNTSTNTALTVSTGAQTSAPNFLPNYLDDASLLQTKESRAPAWIALLGIVLLGSGYWAYQSGSKQLAAPERKSQIEMANHLTDAPSAPTEWVDRIQSRAMAPERPQPLKNYPPVEAPRLNVRPIR